MKNVLENWRCFLNEQESNYHWIDIDDKIDKMFRDEYIDDKGRPWGSAIRPRAKEYIEHIKEASNLSGLDPSLIMAIIAKETSFKLGQKSKKGAVGMMQLTDKARTDINWQRNGIIWIDKVVTVIDKKTKKKKRKTKKVKGKTKRKDWIKHFSAIEKDLPTGKDKGTETLRENIIAGSLYLSYLQKRWPSVFGDLETALCGYSEGPFRILAAFRKAKRRGKKKTKYTCPYSKEVTKYYYRSAF